MQLNEILEENSAKAISKKTNISESNIETLLAGDFDKLKKVKTLGFISILEREYKADLSALKEEALAHYDQYNADESITIGLPMAEEKKGKSKWFLLLVLGLLGYASWYFFTQFDKKQLSQLLPFSEETISQMVMPKEEKSKEELSIENAIAPAETNAVSETQSSVVTESSAATGTEIQVQSVSIDQDTNNSY